jgi:hypothetical protein
LAPGPEGRNGLFHCPCGAQSQDPHVILPINKVNPYSEKWPDFERMMSRMLEKLPVISRFSGAAGRKMNEPSMKLRRPQQAEAGRMKRKRPYDDPVFQA